MVERLLAEKIEGVRAHAESAKVNGDALRKELDRHVNTLWKEMRAEMAALSKQLSEHAKDDSDAMHTIEKQLLSRVPAWALTTMTIGASVIGAMAMYILDHLKVNH